MKRLVAIRWVLGVLVLVSLALNSVEAVDRAESDRAPPFPCGKPRINPSQLAALYFWRDCDTNRWHFAATGGRLGSARAGAIVTLNRSDEVLANRMEIGAGDVLNAQSPNLVMFSMVNPPGSLDEFSFSASSACLSLDDSTNTKALVGPDMLEVHAPVNLATLARCGVDGVQPHQSCGFPTGVDPNQAPFLLWRECGTRVWHLRNHGQYREMTGTIRANSGIEAFANLSLETDSNDFVSAVGDKEIRFRTRSGGAWDDEFMFSVEKHEPFCVGSDEFGQYRVHVGRGAVPLTSPLDPVSMRAASCPVSDADPEPPADDTCAPPEFDNYSVADASFFVAPWGSDSNNGSQGQPFKTIWRATRAASDGDVVLLRGGVYRQAETIDRGGAPSRPVTVAAYPSEQPVFDGTTVALAPSRGLIQVNASDLIFDGIEIRHSRGRGFAVYDSDRVTLQRSNIHHIFNKAYSGSGNDLSVIDNVFHDLVLSASTGARNGPWDGGITTWRRPDGRLSRRFLFAHNRVSRSWGECLIPLFLSDARIHDNWFDHCKSVGIYVDNARGVRIERNTVGVWSNEFNRTDNGRRMVGIGLAVETYPSSPVKLDEVVIANNLVRGTDRGISFFDDRRQSSADNTYQRIVIAHNIICGTKHAAINFPQARGARPWGNLIKNNVLCKGGQGETLRIAEPQYWDVSNNAYPYGTPANGGRDAVAANPLFVSGQGLKHDNYRLKPASPLRAAGTHLDTVGRDSACSERAALAPTIGLFK